MASESGIGSIKLEMDTELLDIEIDQLASNETWTPKTVRNRATQVGIQFSRLAEENSQL